MQPFTKVVAVGDTARIDISIADDDCVGLVVLEVYSSTGTYSITPQIKKQGGSGTYFNVAYANLATAAAVTAGTAITADGIYEIPADGCVVSLNVTTATSTFTVYATKYIGASL